MMANNLQVFAVQGANNDAKFPAFYTCRSFVSIDGQYLSINHLAYNKVIFSTQTLI